ncbi:hypothetical protein CSV61_01605 [Sporosarcina sp. P3]|nr:hypothetical protein CSV61_01605 [Sporosarcina sp. P3]
MYFHNHPSGRPDRLSQGIEVTKRLAKGGNVTRID